MGDPVEFGRADYLICLSLLLFARGMDFLSTWVATPTLALEANPIAKKLGWKLGILINLAICFGAAFYPEPAFVIITTSILVAARNFKGAWLMRTLGEARYRVWLSEASAGGSFRLQVFCLLGETALMAVVGFGILYFSRLSDITAAIGTGVIAYAIAVAFYSGLAMWKMRRQNRKIEAEIRTMQEPEVVEEKDHDAWSGGM